MPLVNIDGTWTFICQRSGVYPKPCIYCGARHTRLCDFPVYQYKSGKKKGEWKTCSARLCDDCTQQGASGKNRFLPRAFSACAGGARAKAETAAHERK